MNNSTEIKIFIAGHNGMVGSALIRRLSREKNLKIIIAEKTKLNLLHFDEVLSFFESHKFCHVYLAAAKVGGINANNIYPADFIFDNLAIQLNVIKAAFLTNVNRLLFLGSSCIYPKHSKQPIKEEELLTNRLEPTNEPYAIAKISGLKLCESFNRQHNTDFRCLMPTNLYGIGDNFNLENSHVIPALIRKFHEAKINNLKKVSVWGTGKVMREFLSVDDLADACFYFLNMDKKSFYENLDPMNSQINIGTGEDITIKNLACLIADVVGYNGNIEFDITQPDGTPRKLLDVSKAMQKGWKANIDLRQGLKNLYLWFSENFDELNRV